MCESNDHPDDKSTNTNKKSTLKERAKQRKKEMIREEFAGKKRISIQERIKIRKKVNKGEITQSNSNDANNEFKNLKDDDSFFKNISAQSSGKKRNTLQKRIIKRKKELAQLLDDNPTYQKLKQQKPAESEHLSEISNALISNGLKKDGYRDSYFIQILNERISKLKMDGELYLSYLRENYINEINIIQDMLSINVTHFFRDRDTWDFILNLVLPELIDLTKGQKIRIWSAGCANGAEPYSISILCSQLYKHQKLTDYEQLIEIIATDISEELLVLAKEGIYKKTHLTELMDHEIYEYFDLENTNYGIKSQFKQLIDFQKLDLINDEFPTGFDLIFCRNVLIYIDPNTRYQIYDKFFKSLKKGGYLILGKSEGIFNLSKFDNIIEFSGPKNTYQKLL